MQKNFIDDITKIGLINPHIPVSTSGDTVSVEAIEEAKEAAGDIPIIASNGIDYDNVGKIMQYADAVIIGTRLKIDNVTLKPVSKEKAGRFMDAVQKARK